MFSVFDMLVVVDVSWVLLSLGLCSPIWIALVLFSVRSFNELPNFSQEFPPVIV